MEESHPGVELVEDDVVSLHAVHKLEDGLSGEVLNAVLRGLRARVDPSDVASDLALADVYNNNNIMNIGKNTTNLFAFLLINKTE